jgi:iron complex outermembrane recepter protein
MAIPLAAIPFAPNPFAANLGAMRRIGWLSGVAIVALGAGFAHPAAAQEKPVPATEAAAPAPSALAAADPDEIVVSGYRRSLRSAINVKRDADFVVDVISSEDIGSLPDISIAESISRLPGVTSQRTGGQASAINIRGLSQDLVSATLNGREQVSTQGDRTIQFDQYPSELVNQAEVYKSPKATQIEGGVAGKVELKTVRPLDSKEQKISVNVRGSFNDRAGDTPDAPQFGYRASGAYIGQFMDNTLGIALGYARLSQPNVATRFVGFDYTGSSLDLNNNGRREAIPYGFEGIQFGGTETRDAGVAVVQYEPADNLHFSLDGNYSKFNSKAYRRGFRVTGTQNVNAATLANATVTDDVITGGRFTGVGIENVNQDDSVNSTLYGGGFNAKYETGALKLNFDASYSYGSRFFANRGLTVRPFVATPNQVTYNLAGANVPTVAINNSFLGASNLLQGFYNVPRRDTDRLYAFAGDANYAFDADGFVKSLDLGVRYSSREAQRRVFSFSGSGATYGSFGLNSPTAVPSQFVSTGSFTGTFAASGYPNFTVIDIDRTLESFTGPQTPDQSFGFTRNQSFVINENVISGYVQANIGSGPISGNVGLRIVSTDQSSGSTFFISQTSTPANPNPPQREVFLTNGSKYIDFLPSLNLSVKVTPIDVIRLAASRQVSRARFLELNNSGNVGVDSAGVPNGGGGNPFLRPFLANQGEIGYEHYFGSSGIFAVAAYYKALETFIIGGVTQNFNFAANGFIIPPAQAGNAPTQATGNFSQPQNGSGGNVYGVEVNYTRSFTNLPAPFDGLGVQLNYSYAKSSINITNALGGTPRTIPLPGLSSHIANPQVFYEKNGFGARASVRYRSEYVAPQFGLNEQITFNNSETIVDLQTSYEFQEGSLKGLKLLGQITNVTDSPTKSYFGQQSQTGTIQYFGRQYYVGASFKF